MKGEFQAYIIVSSGVSNAFSAFRILSSPLLSYLNFRLELVPVPKAYSSDCGLSLLLSGDGSNKEQIIESIRSLLTQKDIKHNIIEI